jgi:hypothetical protein
MTEKKKRVIFYGTVNEPEIELLEDEMTEQEADEIAYQSAIDDYEQYEGMYGLRSIEDIMEEDNIEDFDTAEQMYREERESWLNYSSEEYDPEKHDPDLEF